MRNQPKATAILPWSLRARPGAPVATPVDWTELETFETAAAFTISTAPSRSDPWAKAFFAAKQSIAKATLAVIAGK
jgi:bifunctional non-homologous end joining protein LigD